MKKIFGAVIGLSTALASPAYSQDSQFSPFVDDQGNISRPVDFKTNPDWVHLGAWVVVNANDEGNGMHNVYTTRSAAASYKDNGIFPDGAPLVKEVRGAAGDDLTTGRAHWATDKGVWFVSIKDSTNRFAETNPLWGDGWGWALFQADAPATQVATDYKNDCISCHVPAKASDWMYVHAYAPVLGPKALINQPDYVKAAAVETQAGSMSDKAEAEPMEAMADAGEKASNIDLAKAKRSFDQTCKRCHSATPGKNGIGPSLAGIMGAKAGSVEGYNYSQALKDSDVIWTNETVDKHITDVKTFIPKNKMGTLFPQGVKNAEKRAEIIAYLESLSQ